MTASGPTVAHTYARGGSYAVTLTVTDSAGTSINRVFTGQTVSNNGGPSATQDQLVPIGAYYEVASDGGVFSFGAPFAGRWRAGT